MKTLRYLLIAVMMLSVLSLSAQNMAQQPGSDFRSTSTMVGTGSALPQAAQTGAYVTGNTPGSYSAYTPGGRIRKGASEEDGGDTPPPDPHGPNEDPIGDGMWALALCACAYALVRVFLKKRALSR